MDLFSAADLDYNKNQLTLNKQKIVMMATMTNGQRTRMHPHKFLLWVGLGSIIMMFAGLTSAVIVRSNQANWLQFNLPVIFWYSTIVIICSSITMHLSLKAFKVRDMKRYRSLITFTMLLGVLFGILQAVGFVSLNKSGIHLTGQGSNPSASFLLVITGLHVLHVLGGVIALLVIFLRAYNSKLKNYNVVPVEIAATYWHFVDILWIYLFIFFSSIH